MEDEEPHNGGWVGRDGQVHRGAFPFSAGAGIVLCSASMCPRINFTNKVDVVGL